MSEKPAAPYLVRLLCTLYIYSSLLVQWLVTWVAQVVAMAVAYPFTTRDSRQDMCGHIFRKVSFLGMDVLNPFWKIKVLNKFPECKNKKILVMMNHLSGADPFTTIRAMLPHDGSWVAKAGLFRVPFGGWAMYNAGDLSVKFQNKKMGFATVKGSVGPLMENARGRLRRGRMLCIFPEGIRNRNPKGPLNPFRLGFFSLALEEGATIVPLAISGTEDLWMDDISILNPGTAYFSFGEAIDASKFSTAEELSQHVWNVITELRESHPDRIAYRKAQRDDAASSAPTPAIPPSTSGNAKKEN